jgi:EAL domain-containing protein (putative c-di-GMP-specific phosphodiesterase class I)/GGDEF domain-containing protein
MSDRPYRFVALSFAAADLLIELRRSGEIDFALGSARSFFGMAEATLFGKPLQSFIVHADLAIIEALLDTIKVGDRIGPITLRLKPVPGETEPRRVALSACCLPQQPDVIACALTVAAAPMVPRAQPHGAARDGKLVETKTFIDQATALAIEARDHQRNLSVTVLEVPGLEEMVRTLPESRGHQLMERISALLRTIAVDGETAARLEGNRFGLVHETGKGLDYGKQGIERATREADPKGRGVAVEMRGLRLEAKGREAEAINKALKYVLSKVASDGLEALQAESIDSALEEMVIGTSERVHSLAGIIREENFTLVYQPLVSLKTRAVHHFEALIRFPSGGSPFETIQFAEETDMIEGLDLAVLRRVARLLVAPTTDQRLAVSVNVSGKSLQKDGFVEMLLAELKRYQGISRRLLIEITESAEIKDLARIDKVVQTMRGAGYHICLDDFGAGAASFQYLNGLIVDWVKIDGLYVQKIASSQRDQAMLSSLVDMCRRLNVGTVAERVERAEEVALLNDMGVQLGQGWFFGKPVNEPVLPKPAVEFVRAANRQASTPLRSVAARPQRR